MENFNEEEARNLRNQIESIVVKVEALTKWRNIVTGALFLAGALLGLGTWMMNRSFDRWDATQRNSAITMERMTAAISNLDKGLDVFQAKVAPFMVDGARFTLSDYQRCLAADLAVFEKSLPTAETKRRLEAVESELSHLKDLHLELQEHVKRLSP